MIQRFFYALILILGLGGCSVFDQRINQPAIPTNTPLPFNTATPGGRISVWMIPPTELAFVTTPVSVDGQVVAPAATATAITERMIAATQTAAAPTPQPTFQPTECPATRALSAPLPPTDFTQYPAAIGVFLSNGGATSVLESVLRQWGAITPQGGVIQADTDLTGDKVPEILINLFNPLTYNDEAILNSGQLLIYGCDNQAYRLLFSSPNNSALALPVLHRVGDMNGDVKAEIVYDLQSCIPNSCSREGNIISWNSTTGAFEPLNNQPILSTNGRMGVADVDGDGILELSLTSSPPSNLNSGPTRGLVDVWDWTGQNYTLATRTIDDPRYRIHQLQDADDNLFAGNNRAALRGYLETRDDQDLLAWTVPNEAQWMRAFANYRILTTYARIGDDRANDLLNQLVAENPEGAPSATLAQMGQVFMDVFRSGGGLSAACRASLEIAATRSDVLGFLNSYGTANRTYSLTDLCPF